MTFCHLFHHLPVLRMATYAIIAIPQAKKNAKSDPKMEDHPVLFRGTYRNPLFWSFVWLGDSNWQNTICRHWLHSWGASCHNQPFFMAFPIFLMPFQSKSYAHHFLASFSDGPWWPIIDPYRWVDFQKLCAKAWISESKNSNWQSLLLKSPSKTAESQIQKLVWVVLVESCFILDYHYPRIFALWMAHSVHPVPMTLSFFVLQGNFPSCERGSVSKLWTSINPK